MLPHREPRSLVVFEVLSVLGIAVVPLPDALPVAAVVLLVASLSRWIRGRGWAELIAVRADTVVIGAMAGAFAAAVAAPLFAAFNAAGIDWWLVPATQSDPQRVALVFVIVIVNAIALELALRGWIIERMFERSPGPPLLPIVTAALVEALVMPVPLAARIGAAMFGCGLGAIYVAAGRNVLVPIVARCAFASGCVIASLVT